MRRKNVKKITAMAMSVLMAALTLGSVSSFAAEGTSSEIADEALEQAPGIGTVSVEGGLVQGVESDTEGVTLFKGIPFAADTSGENRWKEPQPVEPWEGVRICDEWGDQAMQQPVEELNPVGTIYGDEFYFDEYYNPPISENGLNLNVYTPAQSADENLPVFVWIHGGANNHGHASEMEFNASKLAEKGIIVVSVQYRMGMFGFLTLPGLAEENEHGVSGNYAILDLVKSLEWVRDNIAGFGGNPNQVTIAGQSAGGYNVTALLRTPLAEGLFQNAIVQSQPRLIPNQGSEAYNDMVTMQESAEPVIKEAMGLPEDMTSEELVAELRSHDAEYYMTTPSQADETRTLFQTITAINGSFAYVLDGYVFTEESVDLTRPGALDGINLIVGSTSNEMSTGADPEGTMTMEEFAETMSATYGEDYAEGYAPEDEAEAYDMQVRSTSDRWLGTFRLTAEYMNAHNEDMNAYTYYFDQNIPSHVNANRDDEFFGCFHSTELWYTFNSMRDVEGQRAWTDADHELADQMSSYIANFVKTGDPNGDGLAEWLSCSAENDDAFMWWHDGGSEGVTSTDNPSRDAINLELARNTLELPQE